MMAVQGFPGTVKIILEKKVSCKLSKNIHYCYPGGRSFEISTLFLTEKFQSFVSISQASVVRL